MREKREKDEYSFRVVEILPHSVVISIKDAAEKEHKLHIERDILRKADADSIGSEGVIFINEAKKVIIEVTKFGKKEERESRLNKILKTLS